MLQTAMVPTRGLTGEQIFTDTQLLALIGRGENWALSEIYARYAGLVFSIALKTLNDQARDRPALSRSARHHQDSLAPRHAETELTFAGICLSIGSHTR